MIDKKPQNLLFDITLLILSSYFLFLGLFEAQSFFKPLVSSIILTLLMIPVSNKMESWKIKRIFSSLINTMFLFLLSLGFFALISVQVKGFIEDWDKVMETVTPQIERFENYVLNRTPLQKEQLEEYKEEQNMSNVGVVEGSGQTAWTVVNQTFGFLADYLLTFIYIFFLLNYRSKFKEFIIRLFPAPKKVEVADVINKIAKVAQQYLFGKFLLILFLAVLYSIGLGISGVNNFIFISIFAATLSIIPYFGNLIAFGLAMALGLASGGESGMLIGVVIVFSLVQFIESYVLEPYIIGDQVDIHPFFIIVSVILGNLLWGVMGMILSVPVVGIINVIFRNVDSLKVFGFLLSNKDNS